MECCSGWPSCVPEYQQCLKIYGCSKRPSVLGVAKSHMGQNLVVGPILLVTSTKNACIVGLS